MDVDVGLGVGGGGGGGGGGSPSASGARRDVRILPTTVPRAAQPFARGGGAGGWCAGAGGRCAPERPRWLHRGTANVHTNCTAFEQHPKAAQS